VAANPQPKHPKIVRPEEKGFFTLAPNQRGPTTFALGGNSVLNQSIIARGSVLSYIFENAAERSSRDGPDRNACALSETRMREVKCLKQLS
jgi:hypothetical protein